MAKLENPITGGKIELTNWKRILGLIGGVILLAGVVGVGLWAYNKIKGVAGFGGGQGNDLTDALGGL